MRIKTSGAMRGVDQWKDAVSQRYRRFCSSLYFLLIAAGFGRRVALPAFMTIALALHFAIVEFASLVVLGALLLRLQSYRLTNLLLSALTSRQTG